MVELVGLHGLDQADVVRDAADVRQHLAEFRAALPVFFELKPRGHDRRVRADERVTLSADDRGGQGLAIELGQLGLAVEQVELRGRARHEEMNDGLGLARKMRRTRREGIDRSGGGEARGESIGEQSGETDLAQADAALAQEPASAQRRAALGVVVVLAVHASVLRDGFVEVQDGAGHRHPRGAFGGVTFPAGCEVGRF